MNSHPLQPVSDAPWHSPIDSGPSRDTATAPSDRPELPLADLMRTALTNSKIAFTASALILVLSWSLALQAELVILEGGDILKVSSFRVLGQEMSVTLPEGGSMTLPLLRISRIVDDEILPDAVVVPNPARPSSSTSRPTSGFPSRPTAS